MRKVGSVEADDVEILIFDPDAAEEAALARVLFGSDVDHDAAHFAEKLAAHKREVIIAALKILVEDDHLRETEGQKFHRVHIAESLEHALAEASGGRGIKRAVVGALVADVKAAQEIYVADRYGCVEL